MSPMRASERQRASGQPRPAWPGSAMTVTAAPSRVSTRPPVRTGPPRLPSDHVRDRCQQPRRRPTGGRGHRRRRHLAAALGRHPDRPHRRRARPALRHPPDGGGQPDAARRLARAGASAVVGGDQREQVLGGLVGIGRAATLDGPADLVEDGVEAVEQLGAVGWRSPGGPAPTCASMRASACCWPSLSTSMSLRPAVSVRELVEQLRGRAGRHEHGRRHDLVGRGSWSRTCRRSSSSRPTSTIAARTASEKTGRAGAPGGSRGDQDAGAGERPDADVAAVDLDRQRAVGRRRGDGARVAGLQRAGLEELEQAGRELQLLGDPADREALADGRRRRAGGSSARCSPSRGSGCRAGTSSGCRAGGPSPPRRPRS